jgi:hypothetical protein
MHRPVLVAQSSFIEGSHMTKNTASGPLQSINVFPRQSNHFISLLLIIKLFSLRIRFTGLAYKKLSTFIELALEAKHLKVFGVNLKY